MENELEKFIQNNRDRFDQKAPDPMVLNRILETMHDKGAKEARGVVIPFRVLRLAAACLVLISCGLAFWAIQKQPSVNTSLAKKSVTEQRIKTIDGNSEKTLDSPELVKTEIVKRKSVDAVDKDIVLRKQILLTKWKARSSNSNKLIVFAGLNNMDSPASRINAAASAFKLKNTGNDVVDALVEALNNDPSANVRLAALDGLARFYREAYVRKQLITSLKKQQDPVVQIALIELLTRMKESGILSELDKLINDDNTMKAVKDCAYSSVFRLRTS
ncbi:HEAT repeat domain-containing protein [uncultured Mucilaginibacter sp.]|uniref:HEAT repeat domain-containing protein n=1 Tax=uncultured Mucilaginibacter sp. TaxID=797541 RepID=UPI002620555B|nr:HEAT repeat domain-containing protein [uncultured Mucilaginibacter sp.]